jgi:hypothetical protein
LIAFTAGLVAFAAAFAGTALRAAGFVAGFVLAAGFRAAVPRDGLAGFFLAADFLAEDAFDFDCAFAADEGFDFFDEDFLDAALAMASKRRKRGDIARLTPRFAALAQAARPSTAGRRRVEHRYLARGETFFPRNPLEVEHPQHAEAGQTHENQIDRHDEVQQARHQQNQNTGDQRDDRWKMGTGNRHRLALQQP